MVVGSEGGEIESDFVKDIPRQPAGSAAPVFPDVLENVGHLQTLSERDRQRKQFVPIAIDSFRMGAKELRQHLADHARDVVAVAVEVRYVFEPVQSRVELKLRHSLRHDPHAALERRALSLREAVGDTDNRRGIQHQVPLRRQRAAG